MNKNQKRITNIVLFTVLITFLLGVSFRQIIDKHTRKRKKPVEYIVVHYTANLKKGADAVANAKYLQKTERAGCHYAIDDKEIVQCVPENEVAYAVGDKKWFGFIPKPWYKNKIYNENSLSFEMCLGGGRNDSLIIDKTAQSVAWQLYNRRFYSVDTITVDSVRYLRRVPDLGRVVRHHDISGKHCPRFNYNDTAWNQQKEDSAFRKFVKNTEFYFYKLSTDREIQ